MALSRSAKIWLIVIGIPVVLLIGGILTLKILFTGERLKEFLVPRIEEATGRSVTLADISLSVFPSLAIRIDTLSLSNSPGEGFSARPFLSLDQLVLDVRLWPLLSGRVEVPTISIEKPVLLMEVNAQGVTNYSAAEEEAPEHTAPSEARLTGGGFFLSDLRIADGRLEYNDAQQNSSTILDGVDLSTEITIDPEPHQARFRVEASVGNFSYGSLTTPLISGLALSAKGGLLYHETEDRLEIEEATGSVADIGLTMRGEVTGMTGATMMDLVIESPDASIPDLLSLAPKEYMKKAEGLEGTGNARIKVTMKGPVGDSQKPDVTGVVSATNATVRYASLPKPITNVNIVADFTRSTEKQEFRVTDFSANLGNNPLSARMTVENFDDPSMDLTLDASLNLAEVKDYYPLEEGTELGGKMKADVSIAGKVSAPKSMKASGSLDFQGVTIKTAGSRNPVRNMTGSIRFSNELLESKKLTMVMGRSDLTLAFWVRNYLSLLGNEEGKAAPAANLTLSSNHFYTEDLSSEEETPAAGKGKKEAASQAPLPLPGADLDIAASIGTLTMEKFELKNVRSTMHISDGVIRLQNFSGNLYNGTLITKGTVDMRDAGKPLFDLSVELNNMDAHQFLPEFTSFGSRLFGTLTMKTTMKGALDDTLGLIPQSLSGFGNVQMKSGKVEGVKVNQTIAGMLGLPDLQVVKFKDWENAFSVENGRMAIKDLRVQALNGEYFVNGSVGLDGSLDYVLTILLPPETSAKVKLPGVPGFVGQAVDLFKDPSGKVRLDFNVGGTADSPTVSLNTDAAKKKAEDLAKQKLAEEKKKLEEEMKKKAGDLLKDFDPFKKKKDGP